MLVPIGVTLPTTKKKDAAADEAQKPTYTATRRDAAADNNEIATTTKSRR